MAIATPTIPRGGLTSHESRTITENVLEDSPWVAGYGLALALMVRRSGVVEARWTAGGADPAPLVALSIAAVESARSLAEIAGSGSPDGVDLRAEGLSLQALRWTGTAHILVVSSKPLPERAVRRIARHLDGSGSGC